jgi:hypothetical protein
MYKEATDVFFYKMNIQFSLILVFSTMSTLLFTVWMSDYAASPQEKKYELLTHQYRISTIQTHPSSSKLRFIDQARNWQPKNKDETMAYCLIISQLYYRKTIQIRQLWLTLISQSYHGKKKLNKKNGYYFYIRLALAKKRIHFR